MKICTKIICEGISCIHFAYHNKNLIWKLSIEVWILNSLLWKTFPAGSRWQNLLLSEDDLSLLPSAIRNVGKKTYNKANDKDAFHCEDEHFRMKIWVFSVCIYTLFFRLWDLIDSKDLRNLQIKKYRHFHEIIQEEGFGKPHRECCHSLKGLSLVRAFTNMSISFFKP